MVETPCQSGTGLIDDGARQEKINHCVDDGSCGLNRNQLIDKGVEFGNHCWWTKYNSMEKLKSNSNVLIYYSFPLSVCVYIGHHFFKDARAIASLFDLFHGTHLISIRHCMIL